VNYNLLDRYLLTATVRRDGSSVFGEDEKFGIFPSASVGWSIAQEEFMQDVDWVSQLKLRLSYGITGNQAVPPYESLPTLASSTDNSAVFGSDQEVIGTALDRAANPDLKWEETREINVGLDFTASRFDGSLEFYQRTTTDLLFDVPVLQPAPSGTRLENVGEVENLGVEATVDAFVIDRDDLSFTVGANIGSNKNEITDLGGRPFIDHTDVNGAGQTGVNAQRLDEGHPIGAYYGPVFTGIDDDGNETYRTADGGTTTEVGEAEETFIGNPVPDFSYGLNFRIRYQDFDLGAFFRGQQGADLFNNTALEFYTKSNLGQGINLLQGALTDGTNQSHVPVYSSRWIQDASFLRLDKLTLGYTLPNASGYGLRRARVYVTGQNLLLITGYDGFDPEVNTNVTGAGLGFRNLANPTRGIDYTSYPRARSFTLGVEVGF
jgi:iron complex outermembrane receptor protein